jgi:hypothetical protein
MSLAFWILLGHHYHLVGAYCWRQILLPVSFSIGKKSDGNQPKINTSKKRIEFVTNRRKGIRLELTYFQSYVVRTRQILADDYTATTLFTEAEPKNVVNFMKASATIFNQSSRSIAHW